MQQSIIAACEAFSVGRAESARPFLAESIVWHIVGDRTIDGHEAVKAMCEEAAQAGAPNFENGRIIRGKHHLVIEGRDLDSNMHYCDIYTIEKQQVMEITSYSLIGDDSTET